MNDVVPGLVLDPVHDEAVEVTSEICRGLVFFALSRVTESIDLHRIITPPTPCVYPSVVFLFRDFAPDLFHNFPLTVGGEKPVTRMLSTALFPRMFSRGSVLVCLVLRLSWFVRTVLQIVLHQSRPLHPHEGCHPVLLGTG